MTRISRPLFLRVTQYAFIAASSRGIPLLPR